MLGNRDALVADWNSPHCIEGMGCTTALRGVQEHPCGVDDLVQRDHEAAPRISTHNFIFLHVVWRGCLLLAMDFPGAAVSHTHPTIRASWGNDHAAKL